MAVQRGFMIHAVSAAVCCGSLVICACSDSVVGPNAPRSAERRAEVWVGQYASAPATVILNDTPTSIEARLDLYQSPACQLYATFTTEAPDDWAVFHTDSCLYQVSGGTVTLRLKIRVHYPGGNDLIEGSTSFERVDADWTAVVWTKFGIRLEAIAET